MRYRILIIDHDDTSVDSSEKIHYPAHLEVMKQLRPEATPGSLETWFQKNFDPGIMEYFKEELLFSDKEIEAEYKIWRQFTQSQIPEFYPGIISALGKFQNAGGRIAVVSHSDPDIIRRDYAHAGVSEQHQPEHIFGWDPDPLKRKPHPYPVLEIMSRFNARPDEILVVDDLKPGIEMAQRAGVDAAAAGWAHSVALIKSYMMRECVRYFESVYEFTQFILA